jgi:hypothetical protein
MTCRKSCAVLFLLKGRYEQVNPLVKKISLSFAPRVYSAHKKNIFLPLIVRAANTKNKKRL